MTTSRSRNDLEYLRGEIRHLKKTIKVLKKLLNKSNTNPEYIEEGEELEELPLPDTDVLKCPQCNTALNTIDLASRLVLYCNDCNYRKVIKHGSSSTT